MSYLEEYDSIPLDRTPEKVQLVSRWIRTDWQPFFQELRQNRPIFETPAFTLLTRFTDVQEVLSRPEVFSVRLYASKMDPVVDGPFMLARDNTEVNWREKSIMKTMLQREDLPRVRKMSGEIADTALDRWSGTGKLEVVSQLGRYVPVQLCGDYFGFPGPDLESMFRWSKATQSDMFKNLATDPAIHAASVRAGKEMTAYLSKLLDEKKEKIAKESCTSSEESLRPRSLEDQEHANQREDIFTRLIKTHFPQDIRFDEARIITNMAGLLIGSVETVSQAVVQALEYILLNPAVFQSSLEAAQANDDDRFDRYVWEALRFNPINPLVFRFCEEEYTLAAGTAREKRIAAKSIVFACTASAMFDASELVEPQTFSIERPAYHYLHFGYGHHTCLGKYIGLVEIPEIIKRVLLRPGVRLIPTEAGVDFQGGFFPERFAIAFDC